MRPASVCRRDRRPGRRAVAQPISSGHAKIGPMDKITAETLAGLSPDSLEQLARQAGIDPAGMSHGAIVGSIVDAYASGRSDIAPPTRVELERMRAAERTFATDVPGRVVDKGLGVELNDFTLLKYSGIQHYSGTPPTWIPLKADGEYAVGDRVTVRLEQPGFGQWKARITEKLSTSRPEQSPTLPAPPSPKRTGQKVLSVPVITDLSVSELQDLLHGLSEIYEGLSNSTLLAEIAPARRKSMPKHAVRQTLSRVVELADRAVGYHAQLRIHSISIASPGNINLEGSGEIIDAAAGMFERVYQRKEAKRAAQLENEDKEAQLRRSQAESQHRSKMADLELLQEQIKTARTVFVELFGEEYLSSADGRAQFRRISGGIQGVSDLIVADVIGSPQIASPDLPPLH